MTAERKTGNNELPNSDELDKAFDDIITPALVDMPLTSGEISRDIAFDSQADRTTIVVEEGQPEDDSESDITPAGSVKFPSVEENYLGEPLSVSSFVPSVDSLHADYDSVLNDAENIVSYTTAKDLLELVGGHKKNTPSFISYSVLERLLEKYIEENNYKNNPNFLKIVEVLRFSRKLNTFNLSEKVSLDRKTPRSYYMFKKLAYIFNAKSVDEILLSIKNGGINPAIVTEFSLLYKQSKQGVQEVVEKINTVTESQKVYEPFYEMEDRIDEIADENNSAFADSIITKLVPWMRQNNIDLHTIDSLLGAYRDGRKHRRHFADYKEILSKLLQIPNLSEQIAL